MHDAFTFHVDLTAFLEHKAIAESLVNRLRHLDTSDSHGGLHPGRDIDGVAPPRWWCFIPPPIGFAVTSPTFRSPCWAIPTASFTTSSACPYDIRRAAGPGVGGICASASALTPDRQNGRAIGERFLSDARVILERMFEESSSSVVRRLCAAARAESRAAGQRKSARQLTRSRPPWRSPNQRILATLTRR